MFISVVGAVSSSGGTTLPTLAVYQTVGGPAFIDTFTTTSLTISAPAGLVSGELLLAAITLNEGGSVVAAPTGWTLILVSNSISTGDALYTYWKIAGGTEPADYTWTVSAQTASYDSAGGGILRINGQHATTPIDVFAANESQFDGADIIAPAVTASSDNSLVIRFVEASGNASYTITGNIYASNGGTNVFAIAHNSGGSVAAVPAYNFGNEGNIEWSAQTIVIMPG